MYYIFNHFMAKNVPEYVLRGKSDLKEDLFWEVQRRWNQFLQKCIYIHQSQSSFWKNIPLTFTLRDKNKSWSF